MEYMAITLGNIEVKQSIYFINTYFYETGVTYMRMFSIIVLQGIVDIKWISTYFFMRSNEKLYWKL